MFLPVRHRGTSAGSCGRRLGHRAPSPSAPDNTTTDGERRPLESHCALPGKFAGVSRMAKAQQMRWSRRGADLLLQVRCALYNGTLGTGFGQKFLPANDVHPPMAVAA